MSHKFVQLLVLIFFSEAPYFKTIKLGFCYGGFLDSNCLEIEAESLLKLKEGLYDPSGRLSSWRGNDCCNWKGVTCSNRTSHVTSLELSNVVSDGDGAAYALGGNISSSLVDLEYLSYIDLSLNYFEGIPIPDFLGSLKNLEYLNLSHATFSGSIPRSFGNLSNLQFLDLRLFTSEVVENDIGWISSLSSLEYLDIGEVDLTGASSHWLADISSLSSLLELHLPKCNLVNIPLSLPFVNFASLSVLDLSNNGFNSTLPSWIFNLPSLTQLDLSSNNFHGVLPDAFSKLRSLERLDLSSNFGIEGSLSSLGKLCNLKTLKMNNNKLTGEITKFVDSLSECSNKTLETLDLGKNDLTGDLPTSIALLESLQYLLLWHNSFTGSVPETIGKLSSLKQLYLSDNKMSGNITENLGQLSSLIDLDLSENPWGGIITEAHMMNLSSLKEFSIGIKLSNNITLGFNISPEWIPPFQLKLITIQSCKLGPKFPGWIKNQKELSNIIFNTAGISDTFPDWFLELNLELNELDVAYNELSGKVPNSFRFVESSNVDLSSNLFEGPLPFWSSNVSTLYLRDNKFSGPIPPDIGTIMPFLSDIDISRNSLNGSIPMSIADMNELTTLVISSNFLSGEIPDFFENLPMLLIVDMYNNSLSGQIPRSLGSLNLIKFLILSGNNLSGGLPSSLRNCTELASMDLGDNRLSGTIPSWIGESMSSLLILRLRNNSFTGQIPAQLCNLSVLHILDLSENILSGALHRCMGNLTGFKVVLDTNKIYEGKLHVVKQGRVAQYSSTLYLVNSIDLSNNKLHGEIPEEVTLLSVLWTLNLSMNHLTGNIPSDIGKLSRLETLDLSRNELSGHIPTTISSSTFLNHLNLSFNNFSGRIPTGSQFETLDPSIYKGNTLLCGDRLNITCGSKAQTPDGNNKNAEDEDSFDTLAFYGVIGVGFFTGFCLVCGTLVLKKDWRDAYFYFLLKMYDRILAFPASIHCLRNWKMPANETAEINQSITRYVVNTSA